LKMSDIAGQISKKLVLGEVLARNARKFPDRVAIVFEDKTFTYHAFNQRVNRLAQALLADGIKPGHKVAFVLFNGNEILESYFAAFKIGAVAVPLNYRLAAAELEYALGNSEAKALIHDQDFEKILEKVDWAKTEVRRKTAVGPEGDYESWISGHDDREPEVYFEEEAPALIMYTAGTTGKPKGAVLTHKNLFVNTTNWMNIVHITEEDCWFSPPPLFHVAALSGVLPHIFIGGKNVLARMYRPVEFLQLIEREKVTGTVLIPTMWIDLLQLKEVDQYDSSSIRLCFSGGAILPVEIKKKIIDRWGQLYESFGQTEMSPNVTMLLPKDALRKTTSVGKAMPNVEIRVVDAQDQDVPPGEIGEAIYRGPSTMLEYYRAPEATAEAFRGGWFHSGDLVHRDEEGFIYVAGRKKDMIISGGENIYPAEIEEVLYRDSRIVEVAVIGLPDPRWGENVAAVIRLRPGVVMSEQEVIDLCTRSLAGFKKPKRVFFAEELPRNAAGKILKNRIREHYEGFLKSEKF
jgi:fatty-acyl-CoA synthase